MYITCTFCNKNSFNKWHKGYLTSHHLSSTVDMLVNAKSVISIHFLARLKLRNPQILKVCLFFIHLQLSNS